MESEEARQKLLKALEKGNVEWSDEGKDYFARAGVISANPDFTIVKAKVSFYGPNKHSGGGINIAWQTESAGFGTLSLYLGHKGRLIADTEMMDRSFCKSVLSFLIDSIDDDCFPKAKEKNV